MLPGGIGNRVQCCYELTEEGENALGRGDDLDSDSRLVLEAVAAQRGGAEREKLMARLGPAPG